MAKQAVDRVVAAAVRDQQQRAEDRRYREHAGEMRPRRDCGDRNEDQRQPRPGKHCGTAPASPRLVPPYRKKHARQKLPRAEGKEVEGRLGMRAGHQDAGDERGRPRGHQRPQQAPAPARRQHDQQRQDDVELLLHRQRPAVQKWLVFRRRIEVARLPPEEDVRQVDRRRDQGLAVLAEREGHHQRPGKPGDRQRHDEEGRRQPPEPSGIEMPQPQPAAGIVFAPQDAADQETGDDEEDVDAHEPAAQRQAEMIQHHREHRDRAQPVDIAAIGQGGPG